MTFASIATYYIPWTRCFVLAALVTVALASTGCRDGDDAESQAEDRSDGWPGWTSVSRGPSHLAAVAADGSLWAWGDNGFGQIGQGDTGGIYPEPTQVGTSHRWKRVIAGDSFTLALDRDNKLWAWGYNATGQLGVGIATVIHPNPVRVGSHTWKAIAAGANSSYGIRSDGTLWAWGFNFFSQLGVGDTVNRDVPTQVVAPPTYWSQITAGQDFAVGIDRDGVAYSWGDNAEGQLGLGFPGGSSNTPSAMAGPPEFDLVVAGSQHGIALQADGSLAVWGDNSAGQLGQNDSVDRTVPTVIGHPLGRGWSRIVGGMNQTYAIDKAGALWTAGDNSSGALGQGDFTDLDEITQIGTLKQWVDFASGTFGRTAAVYQSDGSLWTWGYNLEGQMGNGTTGDDPDPERLQ